MQKLIMNIRDLDEKRTTPMKFCVLMAILTLLTAMPARAQAPQGTAAATAESSPSDAATPTLPPEDIGKNTSYIYEKPTFEKLSQLYWALGKFDLNSDQDVDAFLLINECDIYRDFYHSEFDWQNIRESGRTFLKKNKNKFPLRFEISQMIKLGAYDMKAQRFDILDPYKIINVRRFESMSVNFEENVCGTNMARRGSNVEGYPRGLLVETSRPVTLTTLPVPPALAKEYADEKLRIFRTYETPAQTNKNLYNLRDAYLFMKIKFFAYRKETEAEDTGGKLAEVLGILEKMEIYADSRKKKLLYEEDYRQKRLDSVQVKNLLDTGDNKPMLLDN